MISTHRPRVYIELEKVGDPKDGIGELPSQNISCQFTPRTFDLVLKDYKKANYQLNINHLHEVMVIKNTAIEFLKEIDPEKSTFKKTATKIIVTLRKKKEDETWYDLIKKK